MHPILTEHLANARIADLHREAAHQRLVREARGARRRPRRHPIAWAVRVVGALKFAGTSRAARRTVPQARRAARMAYGGRA